MITVAGFGVLAGTSTASLLRERTLSPSLLIATTVGVGVAGAMILGLNAPIFVVIALTFALSMAIGLSTVASNALLTASSPEAAATTLALNQSVYGVGAALGSSAGGPLLDSGGYEALGIAALLFAMVAILLTWRPVSRLRMAAAGAD